MANITTGPNGGDILWPLLTVAFVVLKLIKVIDWSWWWVLSPVWLPLALLVVAVIIAVLINK